MDLLTLYSCMNMEISMDMEVAFDQTSARTICDKSPKKETAESLVDLLKELLQVTEITSTLEN